MRSWLDVLAHAPARSGTPSRVLVVLLGAAFVLASCGRSSMKITHHPAPGEVVVVKPGPPPHAPAHGYRHKHGKTELRYDADLAVYVVVGRENCYFQNGSYFRLAKGSWEMSLATGGPWRPAPARSLPPGLAKKHGPGAGDKGHAKKK